MDDIKHIKKAAESTKDLAEDKFEKKKLKKWRKIFGGIILILCVVILCAILLFYILKSRGENSLKVEERYMTYKEEEYRFRDGIVNILCLGIDKRVPIAHKEASRGNIGMSDVILLVSIDTEKDAVKIFAVPRDTMAMVQKVTKEGELGSREKLQICYQYAYGISMEQSNELTVDAVSRLLYDIPIQRCCAINFEALPILNDAIGGVDVDILEDLEEWDPRLVYGERMHLDGILALRFVRVRNTHRADGAVLRTQRQKQYALAFAEKAKTVIAKDPSIPIEIFRELEKDGNMCTDITVEDITYLMPEVLGLSFSDDVIQVLPGESVLGENGFAEFYMDEETVEELIINTFYEKV